jgi:hypothetical protein
MRKAPKRPISANAPAPVIPFLAADELETPERVITYCFKNKLVKSAGEATSRHKRLKLSLAA